MTPDTRPVRQLDPGMGQAVAERTVLRPRVTAAEVARRGGKLHIALHDPHYFDWLRAGHYAGLEIIDDAGAAPVGRPPIEYESWGEVAERVSLGNALLMPSLPDDPHHGDTEQQGLERHIARATILLSGRHLQHGDASQPGRNQEVFTNCATAATSFALFYLLLNGSGVGRDYSDEMTLVDFDHAPQLVCVLDESHADFVWGRHTSVRDARHLYGKGRNVVWFDVPDSREGWAKAVEVFETMAFEKVNEGKVLVLNFSAVRCKNSPIRGMQMRPSAGPVPLMDALAKVAQIKGAGLDPWHQALYIDHFLAECVLVGGARRAARMSTKSWRDKNIVDFIEVKRPIEYEGMNGEQVAAFRAATRMPPQAFLWSSNNSVTVDNEFWQLLHMPRSQASNKWRWDHAQRVFDRIAQCAYYDGTGEPGLINVDKLVTNGKGWDYAHTPYVGSHKYQVDDDTLLYLARLAKAAHRMTYPMITNPCGEIALTALGGYCVIADVVPFHADTLAEAEDAFRVAARALIRVNTMDCLYAREVARTNRIGVGITGLHEFAWKFFQVGFRDMLAPDFAALEAAFGVVDPAFDGAAPLAHLLELPAEVRAAAFWRTLSRFSRAVKDEAATYSARLGVETPHTDTTMKPAGTTSKLFGLTEAAHLPALAEYLRWVQFRSDDPLVADYRARGYPVRDDLKQYRGMAIVGFPTAPTIARMGMGDKLVLAGDATPLEQYQWLMLLEAHYIRGTHADGAPLPDTGNQVSYTLKYKPDETSFALFRETLLAMQSQVRACSVMPQEDGSAYEYLPEQAISKAEYEAFARAIDDAGLKETITDDQMGCASGACPVDTYKQL
ncbi:ribonucleoside-diphosphate reductase [Polymorphobacter fuscus]|uniref:Ribonucleoside-diphosphate reductase n=1 Tax=Sandarakinorhabdus fusca TaxID=1439888 RepID=A0A7C9GQS3_9SPHN|nr:ribonucleoside-diphosphate reductase [Polymorphobacter fuscus]KAB7643727.1 ribonucleoside-diphosphate reductase [Polymorphobacter fuscus]MQT18672.1 ribonucleoside-diphosphate reductase [Polymorphobacter fuscus]NJC08111.1 hypothetical protein [Polymorphobacter fuscus]